jgi:hypothetical protein
MYLVWGHSNRAYQGWLTVEARLPSGSGFIAAAERIGRFAEILNGSV